MKAPSPTLAPILRSATQGRILALILADPTREYTLSQLVEWAGSSMPTVQREIDRAERAGIVTTRKVGPSRLVSADTSHALHGAVRQLVLGTYGAPAIIGREFRDIEGANAVLLFGSWAARYLDEPGRAPNDIDVLVVGTANRDAVDDAAERAEREVGLPVQATVRSRSQWDAAEESFVQELKSRPLVVALIDDDDTSLATELDRLARTHRTRQ